MRIYYNALGLNSTSSFNAITWAIWSPESFGQQYVFSATSQLGCLHWNNKEFKSIYLRLHWVSPVSYLIFLISQDQVGTLSHLFHRYIFHFFQYQAFRYPPSTIRYQIRRSNTAVTCPLLPTSSHIFPRTTNRTRPLRERSLPQRTAAYQRYRIAILVSYPWEWSQPSTSKLQNDIQRPPDSRYQ